MKIPDLVKALATFGITFDGEPTLEKVLLAHSQASGNRAAQHMLADIDRQLFVQQHCDGSNPQLSQPA